MAVAGAETEGSAGAMGNGSGGSNTDTAAGADSQPQAGGQLAAVQAQPLAGYEGSLARGERGLQLTGSRRVLVGPELRTLWCTDGHSINLTIRQLEARSPIEISQYNSVSDICFADQGEDSLAEMGFGDSKRWAAHPVAMSADCGSAMARVRGVSGGSWPIKKPSVEDLRGGVPLTDEQRQRIESMGTVR